MATLVERHSRFCMLVKVPGKDTATVVAALSQHVRQLPATLAALADLGSRAGDGPAQKLHDGHGCAGLLLRSAESLAARLERKHQRATTAIPAQEGRPVQLSRSRNWTRSLCVSINAHEKPWDFKLRRINCKPVLHRPLETTRLIGNWLFGGLPSSRELSRNADSEYLWANGWERCSDLPQ